MLGNFSADLIPLAKVVEEGQPFPASHKVPEAGAQNLVQSLIEFRRVWPPVPLLVIRWRDERFAQQLHRIIMVRVGDARNLALANVLFAKKALRFDFINDAEVKI